eukprot:scaffold731_cov261-Pinguiococcus_pyrenoidosus.AAC.85
MAGFWGQDADESNEPAEDFATWFGELEYLLDPTAKRKAGQESALTKDRYFTSAASTSRCASAVWKNGRWTTNFRFRFPIAEDSCINLSVKAARPLRRDCRFTSSASSMQRSRRIAKRASARLASSPRKDTAASGVTTSLLYLLRSSSCISASRSRSSSSSSDSESLKLCTSARLRLRRGRKPLSSSSSVSHRATTPVLASSAFRGAATRSSGACHFEESSTARAPAQSPSAADMPSLGDASADQEPSSLAAMKAMPKRSSPLCARSFCVVDSATGSCRGRRLHSRSPSCMDGGGARAKSQGPGSR